MQIEENKVVGIHYELKDDQGEVLDSSSGGDPLMFIFGIGMLIPGLENALAGKKKGEKLQVKVKPEDGYGVRDEGLAQRVPKNQFDEGETIEVGMQFQVDTEQGSFVVTVMEIGEQDILVDGNHPLAGVNLNFDVSVEEVRVATKEELEHGHVHGKGGHHH